MSKDIFLNVLDKIKDFLDDEDSSILIDDLKDKVAATKNDLVVAAPSDEEFPIPKEIDGNEKAIALFSDGACRGNPGLGAWGVMAQDSQGNVLFEKSGVSVETTNNKMELEGACVAIELAASGAQSFDELYLYSDSKYVVDGIVKWVPGWKSRGWKKSDNKAPENLDLWKRLDSLNQSHKIQYIWVKGHSGHPQNERCDSLANMAMDALL